MSQTQLVDVTGRLRSPAATPGITLGAHPRTKGTTTARDRRIPSPLPPTAGSSLAASPHRPYPDCPNTAALSRRTAWLLRNEWSNQVAGGPTRSRMRALRVAGSWFLAYDRPQVWGLGQRQINHIKLAP